MATNPSEHSWPCIAPDPCRENETAAAYGQDQPKRGETQTHQQHHFPGLLKDMDHESGESELARLLGRMTTVAERAGELADYYRAQLLDRDSARGFWDTYMWNTRTIELVWHGVIAAEQIEILSHTVLSASHPASIQSALIHEQRKNRTLQQDLVAAERKLRFCQIELLRRDMASTVE
jgi:hypothetical protein